MKYDHKEIEEKWRKKWEENGIYKPDLDKAKKPFYNLMMFPYPSAEGLHVGSVFTFTGVDTYGRFKRMQGYDVFEPMGLDGFGIHSENYALKIGKHPKVQAERSEANFYRQLNSIGNSFDWSRKLETYDPNYYKWTQWIFIQLFKKGLAYRKKAPVNFCPSCKTVLSDEQVVDGKCERCSSIVEKRQLEQWFFKITDYAERLLNNIPDLNWTNKVKIAQKDWIGKKEGAIINFDVKGQVGVHIKVFTTRQDTLPGATFIVVAPEHPLVNVILNSFQDLEIADQVRNDIEKYVKQAKKKTEIDRTAEGKEKTGVFSGLYVINPLNNEELPVWVADYALMGYGTGALFGDAHDDRDVKFAKKYNIPLKPTLITGDKERDKRILSLEEVFLGYGTLVNSGEFSGLSSKVALEKVAEWLEKHGKGGKTVNYHLRDWLISRQRYWGAPIPMIYCSDCAAKGITGFTGTTSTTGSSPRDTRDTLDTRGTPGMAGWFPLPDDQLPVLLPDVEDWKPRSSQSSSGQAISPLASVADFVNTACPKCGGEARRETDVIDTFLDSAWYFFRYISTEFDDKVFDVERAKKWLPVTMYIGGAEHSVLHLLYSRFIAMVFKDLGLIDFEEPYVRFYAHGLIIKDGAKMSKSKGNVINPDEYLIKYGADTVRAYLRFVGPFDMGGDFRDSGIESMHRFLQRIWTLVTNYCHAELDSASQSSEIPKPIRHAQGKQVRDDTKMDPYLHKLVKEITVELEHLRFNTALARLMMYYNFLAKKQTITKAEIETYVKLIAPFMPFLAEELWQKLKVSKAGKVPRVSKGDSSFDTSDTFDTFDTPWSIHLQSWPTYDEKMLKEDEVTIVVQVNGKVRDQIKAESVKMKDENYVKQKALESDNVSRHLEGREIKKVIYVEGKIVNFVIG